MTFCLLTPIHLDIIRSNAVSARARARAGLGFKGTSPTPLSKGPEPSPASECFRMCLNLGSFVWATF